MPREWDPAPKDGTLASRLEARREGVRRRATAYCTCSPHDVVVSGASAASIHGIPLPWRFSDDLTLEVSVPVGVRAPRGRGIRGRQVHIPPNEITVHEHLRLTSRARTWCDLATTLELPDLVAAGDWLISLRGRRETLADLVQAVESYGTRPGIRRLRQALPLLNDRAESPPESRLRVRLVLAGLPQPEVNADIYDDENWLGRVDLLFRQHKLIIEYEGEYHLMSPAQWHKDVARVNRFADAGYRTIRATAADDRDPTELIKRIRTHLNLA